MRKNVLALSVAAMIGGLGFAGSAAAMTNLDATNATATSLVPSENGIGHVLLVPYYSAQAGNSTLLNIVNTSTVGKVAKVRFRGAANSDDVFDFQVFMSPGDVYAVNISQNADGKAYATVGDNTCTLPRTSVINSTPFVTSRLDSEATAAQKANGTREGYVEILTMADIITSTSPTSLYAAIKHSATGTVNCDAAAMVALEQSSNDPANEAAAATLGLTNPTTGLMANWIIINVPEASSWSGSAYALEARNSQGAATGRVVFWPQRSTAVNGDIEDFTADPLLVGGQVTAAMYDLPDLSTPYTLFSSDPSEQAFDLSRNLATNRVINEFLTADAVQANTDWVISQPTRRYWVAMDYKEGEAVYNLAGENVFYTATNTEVSGRQVCVTGVGYKYFNTEEFTKEFSEGAVISPGTPDEEPLFCGEVSVVSLNNGEGSTTSSVLGANVAVQNFELTGAADAGWMYLTTPSAVPGFGLPILGQAFYKAVNPGVAGGTSGNFGVSFDHRYERTRFAVPLN